MLLNCCCCRLSFSWKLQDHRTTLDVCATVKVGLRNKHLNKREKPILPAKNQLPSKNLLYLLDFAYYHNLSRPHIANFYSQPKSLALNLILTNKPRLSFELIIELWLCQQTKEVLVVQKLTAKPTVKLKLKLKPKLCFVIYKKNPLTRKTER